MWCSTWQHGGPKSCSTLCTSLLDCFTHGGLISALERISVLKLLFDFHFCMRNNKLFPAACHSDFESETWNRCKELISIWISRKTSVQKPHLWFYWVWWIKLLGCLLEPSCHIINVTVWESRSHGMWTQTQDSETGTWELNGLYYGWKHVLTK